MITFSGIDCSGKSTQIDLIKKYYEDKGVKVRVIWSRGGYTSWVEGFKTLIRQDKALEGEEKEAYRQNAVKASWKNKLYLKASIWDMLRFYGIVYKWIELTGTLIICDRYVWDTYIDFLMRYSQYDFENWFCWKLMIKLIKKPTHSFVFTIPAEESMRRSNLKFEPRPEPIEKRRIRIDHYMEEIKNNRWMYTVDCMRPIPEITEEVIKILEGTGKTK